MQKTIRVCDLCTDDRPAVKTKTVTLDLCEEHDQAVAGGPRAPRARGKKAKAACPFCGKRFIPGTGMSAHIRARHPEAKTSAA